MKIDIMSWVHTSNFASISWTSMSNSTSRIPEINCITLKLTKVNWWISQNITYMKTAILYKWGPIWINRYTARHPILELSIINFENIKMRICYLPATSIEHGQTARADVQADHVLYWLQRLVTIGPSRTRVKEVENLYRNK